MQGFSPDDFNAVVQTVAGEAANQPPEAQAAVASTILNRHALLGKPIAEIASDPSIYNGAKTANAKAAQVGSPLYQAIAGNIAPVFTKGPTTSATHFHADMDHPPEWDNGSGQQIGDQVFLDRSDLIAPKAAPSADEIEAHALGQAPGYISDPTYKPPAGEEANPAWQTPGIPLGGPSADEIEKAAGVASASAAPPSPQQLAAAKDAGLMSTAMTNALHATFHGSNGGNEVNIETPLLHGALQGFGDELAGKMFAGATGAKNLVLNALGKPIPYSMAQADTAMTGVSRAQMAALEKAHPIISGGAEFAGAALPWLVGGEVLGAGKAVAEAPSALGRIGQLAGRVVSGGVKGAALGAAGGALNATGNATGSLAERAPSALTGLELGGALGGVGGAAMPIVGPLAAKAGGYAAREAGALVGSAIQGVGNKLNALTGRPVEQTAAEYFAAKSPSVQAVKNLTTPPDVAETVEPTADETAAAHQKLRTMMAAGGKTIQTLKDVPADLPYTTSEALGSQTVNHASSLARRAGTTPDLAVSRIGERSAGFGKAILDDFASATGIHPEEAGGNIEGIVSRLKAEADPLFAGVRAHEGPVWSADLAGLAERPVIKKAANAAAQDLLNAGKSPTAAGFALDPETGSYVLNSDMSKSVEHQPTAETWDLVRQRIGDLVERHPMTGKILPDSISRGNYNINAAKRDLTGVLAGSGDKPGLIPFYRDALDRSGDYLSVQSAFDRAHGSLLTDKVTPKDFAKTYAGLTDGEKQAWAAGVANKLYEQSQSRTGLTQSLLKAPSFQAKLQTVMGDKAEGFIDRMTQRIRLQNSGQRILPGAGSQTAPLALATAESAPTDALGNVIGDVAHALKSPGSFVLKHGLRAALGDASHNVGETPGYRNAYGRLLLQHPHATAEDLEKAPQITVRTLPPARPYGSALGAVIGGEGASHR